MARKWINSTRFSGIRWQQHPTRKHGKVRLDRHFGYRFMCAGKQYEGLLGWETEGWTEQSAFQKRQEYFENAKKGQLPTSPQEENDLARKQSELERARGVSFEEYFQNSYLPEARTRKKEKTLRVEAQHVRDWLSPIFAGKPMLSIEHQDLERIKAAILAGGRAPRTAQHVLAVFRLVWNHARKRGVVEPESPTRAVEVGRIKNARTRFLSSEEANKLLNDLRIRDDNAYRLTLAALHTGARLGELAALTWANVNFEERMLSFMHTKTGEVRVLPMTQSLYNELLEGRSCPKNERVFLDSRGLPWKEAPSAFRQAVKELSFNEGREDRRDRICFHSLRHSAASMMLASGVDVRTVQTHFGWSTLAMLERYTHAMDKTKREAVNALERMLEG